MREHGDGTIYPEGKHLVAALDFGWKSGRRDRRRRYVDVTKFGLESGDEVVRALARGRGTKPARAVMAAAEGKLEELLAERDKGLPADAERQTVGQYLEAWLRDVVAVHLRATTHRTYSDTVRLHVIPEIGGLRLAKLRPQHVRAMLTALSAKGLAPATVRGALRVLHRALEQAREDEVLDRNAAGPVRAPSGEPGERSSLTPMQARKLLAHVTGDRLAALYVLTLGLGPRKSEALGLAWQDLDLERGTMNVRYQLKPGADGKLRRLELKTGRKGHRTVQLPEYVRLALVAHRERQDAEREEAEKAGHPWPESDLVFVSRAGTPLLSRNVHRSWAKHREGAGLPEGFRWHDLRHTTSTFLEALGVHRSVRMEILGHRTTAMADLYTHTLPEMHRLAATRMDALLSGGDLGLDGSADGSVEDQGE